MVIKHGANIWEAAERFATSPDRILDFSSNINPYPLPDTVTDALAAATAKIKMYPDIHYTELRNALAVFYGVSSECLVCGNGVSELIFAIIRALAPPRVVVIEPAFTEYAHAAAVAGVPVEHVLMDVAGGFALDLERVEKVLRRGDLLFICNPNNPTSRLASGDATAGLHDVCCDVGARLVIDEVFFDFVTEPDAVSFSDKITEIKQLIVLRAFTKFYGLPGLRFGCTLAEPDIAKRIAGVLPPWNINCMAEAAVLALLDETDFRANSRYRLGAARQAMFTELCPLPQYEFYPPQTNFILGRVREEYGDARQLYEFMGKQGILIRVADDFPGLDKQWFRLAVKLPGQNKELIKNISLFGK